VFKQRRATVQALHAHVRGIERQLFPERLVVEPVVALHARAGGPHHLEGARLRVVARERRHARLHRQLDARIRQRHGCRADHQQRRAGGDVVRIAHQGRKRQAPRRRARKGGNRFMRTSNKKAAREAALLQKNRTSKS
jgi:hypothetical protein